MDVKRMTAWHGRRWIAVKKIGISPRKRIFRNNVLPPTDGQALLPQHQATTLPIRVLPARNLNAAFASVTKIYVDAEQLFWGRLADDRYLIITLDQTFFVFQPFANNGVARLSLIEDSLAACRRQESSAAKSPERAIFHGLFGQYLDIDAANPAKSVLVQPIFRNDALFPTGC